MLLNNESIKCPACNKDIESLRNTVEEIKDIVCSTCQRNFIFILCKYCNKKIFYNSIKLPINGLNGLNIKCPYSSCGKYFYLTICPKCKQKQKIPKIITEGELIKCIENLNCGYEYLQVRCPRKDCFDVNYFAKPKNFCNSPNGILYNHKKKEIFQKITCNFCIRPIVFYSIENKINRYYDSMKIVCPYESCKKIFNRIICPICSEINIIEGGYYMMGHKLKCIGCSNYFGKIICPKCLKNNPLKKCFFKTGQIMCCYTACAKKSTVVNCIHCRRMNYFDTDNNDKSNNEKKDKLPIPGRQIVCGYKDCGKIFNEVYCPSCNELNPFPEGNFSFGKVYKCLYNFCNKNYQFFVCANCFSYSRTSDSQEGRKYICNHCNSLLANWECPFCHKTILDKNSSFKLGEMVRCPSCLNEYSFCRCYQCQKLIFSKKQQYILGLAVQCESCEKYSVNVECIYCNTKISLLDRIDDLEDKEKIKCGNCQKEFEFEKKNSDMIDENDIYYKNLSILENIQGMPIPLGESKVDDNYLFFENSVMIKDNNLYGSNNIEININNHDHNICNYDKNLIAKNKAHNLCILCHCDKKESVFFPCGHRCTCYKCAVFYFEMYKKCPRCNEDSQAIVQKIYEQFNELSEEKI